MKFSFTNHTLRRERKGVACETSVKFSDFDGDFIQAKKAKVDPKSLLPRYT